MARRSRVPGENHEMVRTALSGGERLFLIGTEGVSQRDCFAVATDHIALFGSSALAGPNREDLGPRFPSLMGLYLAPSGSWERGVVARVPDWKLSTPAELALLGTLALVSEGVGEAEIAGHGGARVMLLVRCHGWDSVNTQAPPLSEAAEAAGDLYNSLFTEGGEEREL
ncbi:MAG: hypothetical protein JXA64_11100 [Candidatus Fermentibacteraceae bacterium]|nr:hypothetical protein [Candidatus Fermentibacteraceae bacterium]